MAHGSSFNVHLQVYSSTVSFSSDHANASWRVMDANISAQFQKFVNDLTKDDTNKEQCVMCMEVGYHSNWILTNRYIVIIRKKEWHAFAIFSAVKLANNTLMDIAVENIFPIDGSFRCDHENKFKPLGGGAVMSVVAGEEKHVFEFETSAKARQFWHSVSDVMDFVNEQNELFSDYGWMEKYQKLGKKGYMVNDDETDKAPKKLEKPKGIDIAFPPADAGNQATNGGMGLDRTPTDVTPTGRHKERRYVRQNAPKGLKGSQTFRESEQSIMSLLEDLMNSQSDDQRMMYMRMRNRQKEYVENDTRTVFVGTWNVNGKVEDGLTLSDWLRHTVSGPTPDIYAIGFQEMDLNLSNVALNKSTSNAIEDKWLRLIEAALPEGVHYRRLQRSRLAGIFLVVYCKSSIIEHVSDLATASVPTGMFNVLGNKGAVAIRFRWHTSSLCFVCCHLAAGENEQDLESRNRDYKYIVGRLAFSVDRNTIGFDAHDLIFFFGDLNYRIDLDIGTVKTLISQREFEKLHDFDELNRQWLGKKILTDFKEAPLKFAPSYKFDINTDNYDTSEKNRTPSYCDRILWRGTTCIASTYTSIMPLRISDHKPVGATFEIGVRRIVPYLARRTYEAVIRQMDVMHNLTLPKASLTSHSVHFGMVRFMENKQGTTILKNDGQSSFHYLFKPCPGGPDGKERLFPPWLTVEPQRGELGPNETKELNFEVYINNSTVADFNAGREKIELGTLILSLVGGRDLFITCEGTFRPSAFGLPLQTLIRMKEPAASYDLDAIIRLCKNPVDEALINVKDKKDRKPFCFIKELWRLCNHIEERGKEENGLFQRPGIHGEIVSIAEALDTCPAANSKTPLPQSSIHSVTEAMLLFLASMPDPIIPRPCNERLVKASRLQFVDVVQVVKDMPKANRDVFHYLVLFMKRVLEFRKKNLSDSFTIASVFVEVLTKDIPSDKRGEKIRFLQLFLENESKDLGY